MYLISAYFDKEAERILQRWMNLVGEKTGNHFLTEHQVPPHMTISSVEARSVEVLIPAFESLEGKLRSGNIQFVSTGQLLPYVFYTTPVLNQYLQELQESVYSTLKDIPETKVSRLYQPFSWLPHVTLGKTLTKEQMQIAFSVMQEQFAPFSADIVKLGLSTVNPHKDVKLLRLRYDTFN